MLTLKIILGLLALLLGVANHETLQNEQPQKPSPLLQDRVEDPCPESDQPDAGRHPPVKCLATPPCLGTDQVP